LLPNARQTRSAAGARLKLERWRHRRLEGWLVMKALVVYDTKFGNTEKVARAIGQALAGRYNMRLIAADDLAALTVNSADLLVVGGPTQTHGLSPGLRRLLKPLAHGELEGVAAGRSIRGSTTPAGSPARRHTSPNGGCARRAAASSRRPRASSWKAAKDL
jgi:hypothetical protein